MNIILSILMAFLFFSRVSANTEKTSFLKQHQIIESLAGCYIVDYSYSEVEALDPNYQLDSRVYDTTDRFTVKEWIKVVNESIDSIRLQHFLLAEDKDGRVVIRMRHQGEIWKYKPVYLYEYIGRFDGHNDRWEAVSVYDNTDTDYWVREVVSLDDGLRYQCRGTWNTELYYPEFQCSSYSPIPGREVRDMGRKDYNTMERKTKIVVYPSSWLEKQNNKKVVFNDELVSRHYLSREVGKHWYVKQNRSSCKKIINWAEKRQPFWDILASVWEEELHQQGKFYEIKFIKGQTRLKKIKYLTEKYYSKLGRNTRISKVVKEQLREVIREHRE